MMPLSERREPSIAFGAPTAPPAPLPRTIIRAPRHAPTGNLTRSIRRSQSRENVDALCAALSLSPDLSEALGRALLCGGGGMDERAMATALHGLFDFEPIVRETPHPLILVGSGAVLRRRVSLALAQRMEWDGRGVALYCLRQGRFPVPVGIHAGGLDVLHVGSTEACIEAVRARDSGDMALIDASCLDDDRSAPNALPMLSLGLNAEVVHVADGLSPLPAPDRLAGVERIVLAGRLTPPRLGALLNAACDRGWAFAGQYSATGLYRPITPEMLAERLCLCLP